MSGKMTQNYYDRYTDENWRIHQQKIRHQQEIQKQLEVSRKTKSKSKIDYPFFTLRHSHGNKKNQPSNSISRRCCKVHSIPASDRVYMVMDGVVVFCSPRTTIDSSKEVMRVDTPEEMGTVISHEMVDVMEVFREKTISIKLLQRLS